MDVRLGYRFGKYAIHDLLTILFLIFGFYSLVIDLNIDLCIKKDIFSRVNLLKSTTVDDRFQEDGPEWLCYGSSHKVVVQNMNSSRGLRCRGRHVARTLQFAPTPLTWSPPSNRLASWHTRSSLPTECVFSLSQFRGVSPFVRSRRADPSPHRRLTSHCPTLMFRREINILNEA